MDKIRLGNDIEMRWSIFTRNGDNKVPYNLEGRALTLSVVNRTGESEIEFFAEGNIVTGVFRGRDQRILGKHGVILRENNGKDGMRTIDACDAFELVACSCEEALGSSGTIQLFHLTFDTTIGAITGTIDPILNHEAEQAEAERKASEIIRKANEEQRIDNEKQRNVNEILRNTAEEERENAEQDRRVKEDLRKADEAERKTNEESRLQSESERVSSEEERLYAESIRVANENARIASEAKRAEAETARIEAEDKRIVSEKNRLSAESSRIANEDSRRANEDSRLSAEAKRVSAELERASAEEERQIAEEERKAKFASMVVQSTGDATDKVMSQKSVTEALAGKQSVLTDTDGGYGQRVAELEKGKANIQHQHTVADITDFPELYYDATAFFTSGAYPSDKYEELLEAVKAKRTVYATIDEAGYTSYIFFISSANSDGSSSRVLLTTIFADGGYLYINTFVLQQSGMTPLQESITGKADKATTLAGYGIGDAYTKSEVDTALNTKQNTLTPGNGISIEGNVISSTVDSLITPITYAELVALRNSSSLVAGMQYRITDYDFTTTEKDTDSAHQLFDIIVTADSESVLNEIARAVHHQYESSEETLTGAIKLYKTDMNGYAYEVDTGDYFLLVGTVEVDGVTYYRYDKYEGGANTGRYILLESIDLDSLGVGLDNPLYPVGGGTYGEDGSYVSHSEDAIVSYENGTITVGSVAPLSNRDIASWELKYTLENTKHSSTDGKGTILWMKDEFRNECNYDFINALFKVYEITACAKSPSLVGTYAIKTGDSNITYGTNSKLASTFGAGNHDNIIKYDGLAKIVLGNDCYYNTFGNYCPSNTFGNNCYYNTFGNSCYSNTFGNDCYSNTFGNDCYSNTFGNYCPSNTFGNNCYYNTFGNNCSSNTFGNDCYSNTFGNYCHSIKLATSNSAITKYNYYRYNHFGDGCQYILFKGAETASSSAQVQNYNFAQGVQGTSRAYLTIDGVRSRAYETKVAKNSSGELKIYCEADLIQ